MYRARLASTLPRVREQIAEAATAAGRPADSVRLVAVTKGHPAEAARAAIEAGLEDLGENRVEELVAKVELLGRSARWHLIGHVQSRKAARALVADVIHSVDSLRLAGRLSGAAEDAGRERVPVLLQVNTSGEESKGGFQGESALEELLAACELRRLSVEGLMTMAPYTDDEALIRGTFRNLRELLGTLRRQRADVGEELSMGMTNDLRIAIEEGSTMVRIGTALFGERETSGVGPQVREEP